MDNIKHRLDELKFEYKKGEKSLQDLDARRHEIILTMARIDGAIQVLDELIEKSNTDKLALENESDMPDQNSSPIKAV